MRSWSLIRFAGAVLTVTLLVGCSGLEPVEPYEPITDPTQLYFRLRINHRAVNLSLVPPYDTLQLTATPLNAASQPLTGLPAPVFSSSDTTRVWVSPEGLLQARQAATDVRIIAELAVEGNMRHADTIYVNVRATAPPPGPATLSIAPVSPDSAVWALEPLEAGMGRFLFIFAGVSHLFNLPINPRILDAFGNPIGGLAIAYESLDPSVARIEPDGSVVALGLGEVEVVARTTVYGVALADTVTYKVTLPIVNGFEFQGDSGSAPTLSATEVVVRQHGYVFWANGSADSVDVRFDDPANVADIPELCAAYSGSFCEAGNPGLIPPFSGDILIDLFTSAKGRRFPQAGTYSFRETRTGATGRVVVVAD